MIPLQIVPARIKLSSHRTHTGEALCEGYA